MDACNYLKYIHIMYFMWEDQSKEELVLYWGEPERAPHKREVRAVGLSVCLSVCP